MTESKLWHNKTEIKNVKLAKMVEFIKTCDQIPHKFNFGHFFSSIISPLFCWGKNKFSENAVPVKWVISFCLGERFAWGNERKWKDSIFRLTNVSSSNLNTINLKLFQGPRPDSGNGGPKKVLDVLENDTKTNLQENIPGKVRFQKKWGSSPPPHRRGACFPQPWLVGYICRFEKNFENYSGKINFLEVHRNMTGCALEVNFIVNFMKLTLWSYPWR